MTPTPEMLALAERFDVVKAEHTALLKRAEPVRAWNHANALAAVSLAVATFFPWHGKHIAEALCLMTMAGSIGLQRSVYMRQRRARMRRLAELEEIAAQMAALAVERGRDENPPR